MNILAIDTAAALCAACVLDSTQGVEKGRAVRDLGKGHAEHVMAVVAEALEGAGLAYRDLDAVAVCVGPGSFTGVRVGVAAARGLALALRVPAIGITTLEALAAEARDAFPGRPVLVVTGNRPDSLHMARFDAAGGLVEGPALAPIATIAEGARADRPVLAGNAAPLVVEAAGQGFDMAALAATADIARYARLAAARRPGDRPRPLYLRAADARPQDAFALPLKDG
ncbi:tRNA (adenosine(37)-N6)-threonylcarbamoyltransferase complex dimerization subunit type 1 TsaB [Chelativorans intermedius]|uniref:tRNA (Adenosine(37)-N6)-threonylcarbamoyltransferase complex dimerization subunit type 1 TsaB n=1 Tax=Chelativorans intermedius TaxID=515947 RepID=A0ABV6D6V2_9HYPH|nr:tRNA (adenosine(37)-N6)-threonylcarbamoyltransferase complex dimerization subunit type 1 TsaB [Chelativorans intermedius]MCT8998208.1 tRNA (adenosine(37)-N6)-threonylcarbamoyltransferase complex dimerization subunit type 1 TsaB [Chelativorans intermedius]